MAGTVGEIEKSVAYRIVMVPVGVAMIAALYSLWTGASWPRSFLYAASVVPLVIVVQRISQRRRGVD